MAWSHSRAALLDRCERLYYEHYYGSHGGWSAEASPRTQQAFRLKHLTTPNAELGRAVHRRAAEIALAVREGAPRPTAATLQAKTHAELEEVIMRGGNDPVWIANPRRAPVLHEAYYGGMGFARRRALVVDMNDRAAMLHAALLSSPVWDAAAMPGAEILFIDEPILITLNGVSTIATPDLVLRLPYDRMIVVDWKTGTTGDLAQVMLYALAVQTALGGSLASVRCDAWLVHLDRSSLEAATVTPAKVVAVTAAQRASVTRMKDLLDDPTHNVPRPRAAFRQATDPNEGCRRCKMLALCSTEFASAKAA
ncbi:PD-(D/E)XK nuclease family protein [Gemmatimonas sp.]|uniref:PD-(D/E)XK nuclease family protein n=1 Tax=Gemmatimonas sp. TaxID=1962908 RepID=UPI003F72BBB6